MVGIAKRPFKNGAAFPLYRGGSKNPLWVSVTGMHQVTAEGYLCQFHGPHRMPTLLKRVDALSRGR